MTVTTHLHKLIRLQDRRYWSYVRTHGTPIGFYEMPLEVLVDRRIRDLWEQHYAIKYNLI